MTIELTDEQKIATFRAMEDAWQAKQWRRCADLLAPDGVLQSMMLEPVVGREVFYERMVTMERPNKQVRMHIHRIGVINGAVFAERTDEIIVDGISRTLPVVGIMEFDGAFISVWREYYDRQQLLRARGEKVD
ncbi:MAG: nuclear transport factor 2 family protein [Betaproteobacteria bacterium]|jgi:limonene-1,2-epoxide hydrolase|nr:nuclear transport factor 2 family protein [Betaproteobacteria bacterium]